MKKKLIIFIVLIFLIVRNNYAQNFDLEIYKSDKFITVYPGDEYKAGWLHKFIFGTHWRDLWTLPLEVEILDLNKFAYGLTPIKIGGGFQTKSLRFMGGDGNIWKFRSINKDPASVLPEELQKSFVADVLQDQISSSNPFAAILVAPILKAVGILQAEPKIVVLPHDPKLGEFADEFGGMLGTIEIHPDENDEMTNFGNSLKILGTIKLLERLEDHSDEKVNSKEFLKARLIDIFLGDWDRHIDQWRWALYEKGGMKIWQPIPRDRDQAFSLYDGIGPSIVEYYAPQINHFGYEYTSVQNITWSGRHLDRRFLVELTKAEWDSTTNYLVTNLTDEVIKNSVKKLPAQHFKIFGEELISKLITRRNSLSTISNEFYDMMQQVSDVWGTNEDDFLEINRLNNEETSVALYNKNLQSTGQPYFYKVFNNSLTDEIRIYLLKGDDKAILKGSVNNNPTIRIISGSGKDEIINDSEVEGYLWSILPIKTNKNKTFIYDSGEKSIIIGRGNSVIDDSKYPKPQTLAEKYEPLQNDRGSDLLFYPLIEFDTDNGLIIGSSGALNQYGFRVSPFKNQLRFSAAYATIPQSFNLNFNGLFNSFIYNMDFKLDITASNLRLTKYYGYGNETKYSSNLEIENYYKLEQKLFEIKPSLLLKLFEHNLIDIGFSYSYQNQSIDNKILLNDFPTFNYGLGKFNLLGIYLNFEIDKRDNTNNAKQGYYLNLSNSIYPKLLDSEKTFFKSHVDFRIFKTMNIFTETTFAFRMGGGKLWGKYPFFKSEFLGGVENLRGFRRERFSGDASVFGQAEIRAYISRWGIIIPGKFGLLSFIETGRVFTNNDKSELWHPSYGAGLWLSFIERTVNISFTYAKSVEIAALILKFSMGF